MKKFLSIGILFFVCFLSQNANAQFAAATMGQGATSTNCTLNGYTHCRSITINSSQVGTGTQTNFPVMVYCSSNADANCGSMDLRTTGNGGFVQHTTTINGGFIAAPADVIFTSDSGCTTKLNWEVGLYVASTGQFEAWVNTTISGSSSTKIYICYGNSGITTYQGNYTAAWNSNFGAVYHFESSGGNPLSLDSTTNANTLTNTAATFSSSGPFGPGNATVFNGSAKYVKTSPTGVNGTLPSTIEVWIHPTSLATQYFMSATANSANTALLSLAMGTLAGQGCAADGCLYYFQNNSPKLSTTSVAAATWISMAVVFNSTTVVTMYKNGVTFAVAQPVSSWSLGAAEIDIGALNAGGLNTTGSLAEVRVSNVALSAAWILTKYNNETAPGTFYTFGTQI